MSYSDASRSVLVPVSDPTSPPVTSRETHTSGLSAEQVSADLNRIKIKPYGAEEMAQWDTFKKQHGWDIFEKRNQALDEKPRAVLNAYGLVPGGTGDDKTIKPEARKAEAKRVLNEYNPKIAQYDADFSAITRNNPTDFTEYLRLNKSAELAKMSIANNYRDMPTVENSKDFGHMTIKLPETINNVEINVSRMSPSSAYYKVDVIPKGGTPIHVDNMTLVEVNRLVVEHPGEGKKIAINSKDVPGVALWVMDKSGDPIDPTEKQLVSIGEGVAVNNMRNIAGNKDTFASSDSLPSQKTPVVPRQAGAGQSPTTG